jgi:hypothetical protein
MGSLACRRRRTRLVLKRLSSSLRPSSSSSLIFPRLDVALRLAQLSHGALPGGCMHTSSSYFSAPLFSFSSSLLQQRAPSSSPPPTQTSTSPPPLRGASVPAVASTLVLQGPTALTSPSLLLVRERGSGRQKRRKGAELTLSRVPRPTSHCTRK